MLPILADIGIIFIFATSVVVGFKNGLLISYLLFVGFVISWCFSVYIAKFLSYSLYYDLISPYISRSIEKFVYGNANEMIFGGLSDFIFAVLHNYGITPEKITHIINSVSKEKLPNEISKILMPGIIEILKPVFSGMVFAILGLTGRICIRKILSLLRFKTLSFIDRVIGAIFGAFKGYVAVLVCLCIIRMLVPFIPSNNPVSEFIGKANNSTLIFKKMYNDNILYTFIKKV